MPSGPRASREATVIPDLDGLRLALIGSRGIPARYGGYETLMEELAVRLAEAGAEVTVYCRSHYTPRGLRTHRGVRLAVLPTVPTKYFDTPVHTLLSCLHASAGTFDAALVVNSVNVLFVPLLSLARVPTALNVDGIEKRRAKWGPLGRAAYALAERLAALLPDALVTDARVIRDHYRERYGAESTIIVYGVDPRPEPPGEVLGRLGLESRGYVLYVSRFEPENNPHRVVEAYRDVGGDMPLVMVGDAPYAARFIRSFQDAADSRVLFPGAIYGRGYRELLSHAWAYVHATEVGGTHPALVEAMGYGNCVLVNDTEENREVARDAGFYFDAERPATLSSLLERLLGEPDTVLEARRAGGAEARARFSWDEVTARYAQLLASLASG